MESTQRAPADPTRRRIEWRLFALCWLVFAFFHQGGGWNQNGRFATVRALVEKGRLSIDSHMLYTNFEPVAGGFEMRRKPLDQGHFVGLGRDVILGWMRNGQLVPVRDAPANWKLVNVYDAACTGDLAFRDGRFYHRSAPGLALLGVPAYFALYQVERWTGISPDNWWVLTVNSWLTSVFSVALISALGCVMFFRLGLLLWGEERKLEALLATLTFALGTLFLPYATMLYEHDVTAVGLLAAFYLLLRASRLADLSRARAVQVLGGLAAGIAASTSYSALVVGLILGVYLWLDRRRRPACPWFVAGLAAPLLLVLALHWVSFGGPLTSAYDLAGPVHDGAGNSFLDELGRPRLTRLLLVLFSPLRGLFVGSPVLLLGVAGIVAMVSSRKRRAEGVVLAAIVAFFLLLVISHDGWHGGRAVGPRHLVPALPFLALPLTWAFGRWFRTTLVLALASMLGFMVLTIVDPQSPAGTTSFASIPGRADWRTSPLIDYAGPIFFTGHAGPILHARWDGFLEQAERDIEQEPITQEERSIRFEARRVELERAFSKREDPFTLALFRGPVSANPTGIYELSFNSLFQPLSPQVDWNSFNAGELLVPTSRLSLLMLLAVFVFLLPDLLRLARTEPRSPESAVDPGPETHGATA